MKHYPEEHKQAVIRKLLESGLSLSQFAKRESINLSTLYSWQNKYLKAGAGLADSNRSDDWSPEQKFSVVLETAALSEIELSQYCREKGLYPEQVKASLVLKKKLNAYWGEDEDS